jgi:16S rRNA (uracil1498-N3)-methyltransferase
MQNLRLADIELFYSKAIDLNSQTILIDGEESNHIINVMRHEADDEIYITAGEGKIYRCQILLIKKKLIQVKILDEYSYQERFPNITFCIPKLRSMDRFEFALEKCTELGITNFAFYYAKRAVSKEFNHSRIEKILISAMKQSLLSWLPRVDYLKSSDADSMQLAEKVVFDQNAPDQFKTAKLIEGKKYIFIFGPEGGLTKDELNLFEPYTKYNLADNRLRTETAIIKAASLL